MRTIKQNLQSIADYLPKVAPRTLIIPAAAPHSAEPQVQPLSQKRSDCPDCFGNEPNPSCARCSGTLVVCERCRGAGHIYREVGGGRPAEMIECTLCHNEPVRRRIAERIRTTWLPAENFRKLAAAPIAQFADSSAVYASALSIIDRFATIWPEGVILSMSGNYGTAKTHLLSHIWSRSWAAGRSAIYIPAMVAEKMLTNFDGRHGFTVGPERAWDDMASVALLLVDEADRYTHKADEGSYFERNFFALVEERLQRGRSIVLAGNDLRGRMHEGILSRASSADCAWIDLSKVPDARPLFGRNAPGWMDTKTAGRPPLVQPYTKERLE